MKSMLNKVNVLRTIARTLILSHRVIAAPPKSEEYCAKIRMKRRRNPEASNPLV